MHQQRLPLFKQRGPVTEPCPRRVNDPQIDDTKADQPNTYGERLSPASDQPPAETHGAASARIENASVEAPSIRVTGAANAASRMAGSADKAAISRAAAPDLPPRTICRSRNENSVR